MRSASSFTIGLVKHLRVFLLVLLAVLLPVRGAVAAAMLCAGPAPVAVVADAAHAHHGADHGVDQPAHDAGHHEAGHGAGHDGHDADHAHQGNACPTCASGCCVTPLAVQPPSVQAPAEIATVAFPALTAPAPAFQSGGFDRPPRTC